MQPALLSESTLASPPLQTHPDHPPEDLLSFLKETLEISEDIIAQAGGKEAREIIQQFSSQGVYASTFLKWLRTIPTFASSPELNRNPTWSNQSVLHVGRSTTPLTSAIACVWDGFLATHWGNAIQDAQVTNIKFQQLHQLLLTVQPTGAHPWI